MKNLGEISISQGSWISVYWDNFTALLRQPVDRWLAKRYHCLEYLSHRVSFLWKRLYVAVRVFFSDWIRAFKIYIRKSHINGDQFLPAMPELPSFDSWNFLPDIKKLYHLWLCYWSCRLLIKNILHSVFVSFLSSNYPRMLES